MKLVTEVLSGICSQTFHKAKITNQERLKKSNVTLYGFVIVIVVVYAHALLLFQIQVVDKDDLEFDL